MDLASSVWYRASVLVHVVVDYYQGNDVLRFKEAALSFFLAGSGESGRDDDSDCD